ncbi:hypothetical protein BDI4_590018 [Burkholderia diffusa]|nr:hypothetical protein BDI4_590018 [Burkholderia diffusa]
MRKAGQFAQAGANGFGYIHTNCMSSDEIAGLDGPATCKPNPSWVTETRPARRSPHEGARPTGRQ